jgi:muramoyltetrapeptide carboxypeptidase
MIRPPYLNKGDKIAIVSPARSVSFHDIHPAIRILQKSGLEVVLGTHVFSRFNQFAGTDDQRRSDLQQMLDDPSIRAVLFSRGGYGTIRLIDDLDFGKFRASPKWIIGYSDATVLHAHIHRQFGIETLHAAMPVNITSDTPGYPMETLINALQGFNIAYSYQKTGSARDGTAEGVLTGGNLSILYSLLGSASDIDTSDKILLIEDVDEYLYHVERMMISLKRAGKMGKLAGLIVGSMARMNDNTVPFGNTAAGIIYDLVKEYRYPLCFDFPAGHTDQNLALILGRKVKFSVGKTVELTFL